MRPSTGLRMLMLAAAVATSGCYEATDGGPAPAPPAAVPALESVDTDASDAPRLAVAPGQGAGLWVQYRTGGLWDVFTSCDTTLTGRSCAFDVLLSAETGAALAASRSHDFQPADAVAAVSGSIHLVTTTTAGLDGVTFTSDPGATLRVDMLLDGEAQPAFVDWVSGGLHQAGTPTNPVDFVPTAP